MSAKGGPNGGDGGTIEPSGHSVDFTGLLITTAATRGKAGTWLIDPEDLTIDAAAAATIQSNLANSSVALQTTGTTASGTGTITSGGAGDITINSAITWDADTTLTLDAYHSININSTITAAGSADVVLKTNNGGSGGDLSFGLTGSGFTGHLDFTCTEGAQTLNINSADYKLVYSLAQLDAIDGRSAVNGSLLTTYGAGLAGNYALATSLDASGITYQSALIGGARSLARGAYAGLGHVISDLKINSTGNNAEIFGYCTCSISDVGILGGQVSGTGLVGSLVGLFQSGSIKHSFSTAKVVGDNSVGGLVGRLSSATVGMATVSYSYATGSVSGRQYVGGLLGQTGKAEISYAYATGSVSGSVYVGGLVGDKTGGTITGGYYDSQTTGQSDNGNGTGLTTSQMKDPFTFIDAGWNFATDWGKSTTGANNGYMMLRSLSTGLYDDYVHVNIANVSRTYGDSNSSITGATVTGSGASNLVLQWGSAITAATNAGDYAYSEPNVLNITYSNGGKTVYSDLGSGKLTINKATLTVKADNLSKTIGSQAALTYTAQGLKGSDSVSSAKIASAGAAPDAVIGSYVVSVSDALGSGLSNYEIQYVDGQLEVKVGLVSSGNTIPPVKTASPWSKVPQSVLFSPIIDGSDNAVIAKVSNIQSSNAACQLSANAAIACSVGH